MPNITYHVRAEEGQALLKSGSFGGDMSPETVQRMANAHGLTVSIKPSGRAVFVDREGRAVSLYFRADPMATTQGRDAYLAYAQALQAARAAEMKKEAALLDALADLTARIGADAALALIGGKA